MAEHIPPPPAAPAPTASSAYQACKRRAASALAALQAGVMGWAGRHKFITTVALLVGSCSFVLRDRHVSWDEEVPLNTGETIWVKRELVYTYRGRSDNLFEMSYGPNWKETLSFEWHGKKYSYTGEAGIMLVAISPMTQQPVLTAKATIKNWDDRNHYKCTTPYYVQFKPDASGQHWSWPPQIEPWLYELPYNLMYHKPELSDVKRRYTTLDRKHLDHTTAVQSPALVRVDAHYSYQQCRK